MRNKLFTAIAGAAVAAAMLPGIQANACHLTDAAYYPMTAEITEMDYDSDLVTVTTPTGHEFQFFGCEDYFEGDLVSMIMDDNGTRNIDDDIIISVRYSGYYMY